MKSIYILLITFITLQTSAQISVQDNFWMDETCSGMCDGMSEIMIIGGVAPYVVDISSMPPSYQQNDSVFVFEFLCPGFYDVNITDANFATYTHYVNINPAATIDVTITTTNIDCFGDCSGSAVATVAGGTTPYSYLWNGTTSFQPTASGLCAGTHSFDVIDATGCSNSAAFSITEPASIIANITSGPDCGSQGNGWASGFVSGGVGAYTYMWSNGSTTQSISGLIAGPTYVMQIVDGNGCSIEDSVQIFGSPTPIEIIETHTDASCADGSIIASINGGISPYDVNWLHGDSLMILNNLQPGEYWLEIYDSIGCYDSTAIRILDLGGANCSNISGNVIHETNSNCIIDAGETGLAGRMMTAVPGNYHSITDANGHFEFNIPYDTYTITEAASAIYADLCNGGSRTATTNAGTPTVADVNFYDTLTLKPDASVSIYGAAIRPGFNTSHSVYLSNQGYGTMDGTLCLLLPSGISITSTNPIADATSGDTLIYNISSLTNVNNQVIHIYGVGSGVSLGSIVETCAWFKTTDEEADLTNNDVCLQQTVIGSYDPNDKAVSPAGDLFIENDELTYTIRFQNTGTDTAFNVVITDTLSQYVDLRTFNVTTSSHNMVTELVNENVMKFVFADIMLVDSNANEPLSHGFVQYKINTSQTISVGNQIDNTANIYFDFNEPVITNTTQSLVIAPVGVITNEKLNGKVYPNPFNNMLSFEYQENIIEVIILDINGKLISSNSINRTSTQVKTSSLAPGVYLVKVKTDSGIENIKVIKE